MKNFFVCLPSALFIGVSILILSCNRAENSIMPDPEIKAGMATVSGKITGFELKEGEKAPVINLAVVNNVTSKQGAYKVSVNADGSFVFEVPVECSYNIGVLGSILLNPNTVSICLMPGEVTEVEIAREENGDINANMKGRVELPSDDMVNYFPIFERFLEARDTGRLYLMTPDEFSRFAIDNLLENRIKRATVDVVISEKGRRLAADNCKMYYLKGCLLSYTGYNMLNYRNDHSSGKPESFTPATPDISYYKFLKEFNLNDPQWIYSMFYSTVLQMILSNETMNIPPIDEMPVNEWLQGVKKIMSELIGNDQGLFYDMLVANAYSRQFVNELRPLSEKQIENIRSYFSNEEYVKILLRKNEEIIKADAERNKDKPVINSTPQVSKEAIIDAILSKYKGKPVVVDLWATWCTPCINAMEEMHEVKSKLKKSEVVFVYISNPSSPQKQWEEKAKTISGEHYYLSQEEWIALMDRYGFEAIPSYLFFDAMGNLKNKQTGYPGNESMLKMIQGIL